MIIELHYTSNGQSRPYLVNTDQLISLRTQDDTNQAQIKMADGKVVIVEETYDYVKGLLYEAVRLTN